MGTGDGRSLRYARVLLNGTELTGLVTGEEFVPLPPEEVPVALGGCGGRGAPGGAGSAGGPEGRGGAGEAGAAREAMPASAGAAREAIPLAAVRLLAPVRPGKVVAVGLNYRTHAAELGLEPPEEPLLFMKPPSAVVGPGDPIVLPPESERVDYEGELAVVVGARLRRASVEEAEAGVFGFTCANDVTARDIQRREQQWTRAKGFDTFCPLGPWVVTGLDAAALRVATYVNGARRQWDSTANLIFRPAELLSRISRVMTLLPGDVVLTGTPAGIGPLGPGDVVEVEVEGVGRLSNPVVEEAGTWSAPS